MRVVAGRGRRDLPQILPLRCDVSEDVAVEQPVPGSLRRPREPHRAANWQPLGDDAAARAFGVRRLSFSVADAFRCVT